MTATTTQARAGETVDRLPHIDLAVWINTAVRTRFNGEALPCSDHATLRRWLDAGWPIEVIHETVTGMVERCTDPPSRFVYFEKAIARAVADASRPVPTPEASRVPPRASRRPAVDYDMAALAALTRKLRENPQPGRGDPAGVDPGGADLDLEPGEFARQDGR